MGERAAYHPAFFHGRNGLYRAVLSKLRDAPMSDVPRFIRFISRTSLVAQIVVGLVAGALLALLLPAAAKSVALLGDLFVQALKAVAPILVFVLVTSSLANHKRGQPTHIRPIILLYALGTLSAAAGELHVSNHAYAGQWRCRCNSAFRRGGGIADAIVQYR